MAEFLQLFIFFSAISAYTSEIMLLERLIIKSYRKIKITWQFELLRSQRRIVLSSEPDRNIFINAIW